MIHWQYIKGAYKDSSNTSSNIPYTFIEFHGSDINSQTLIQQTMLPKIYIAKTNSYDINNMLPAGNIICSGPNIPNSLFAQDIYGTLSISQNLKIAGLLNVNEIKSWLPAGSTISYLKYYTGSNTLSIAENSSNSNIYIGHSTINGELRGHYNVTKYLTVGNPSIPSHTTYDDGDVVAQALYSQGICQAQYFNSTSDRRAKTDIKPINKSVLPLITNTQLYSFKYKDLDTPSIGIIAQDVQDVDFDGFSLVDNKEASGQDMDYMSIHESKLVYVLWKAIQEQQKEIEDLKEQIKKGL